MRLEDYPLALSGAQVAEILGVSRTHVWRLVQRGTLPSIKIGRIERIPRSAIEELLAGGSPQQDASSSGPGDGPDEDDKTENTPLEH